MCMEDESEDSQEDLTLEKEDFPIGMKLQSDLDFDTFIVDLNSYDEEYETIDYDEEEYDDYCEDLTN